MQTSHHQTNSLNSHSKISAVDPNSRYSCKTPHLIVRGGIYYFRIAIPKDLRQVFPRREIKRSLRSSNIKAARLLAAAYESETQNLFAVLRVKLLTIPAPNSSIRLPPDNLTSPASATPPPQHPEKVTAAPFLSEAINEYVKERKQRWSPRTELEFTGALKLLIAILGNKKLPDITRPDCVSCRDELLEGKGRKRPFKGKKRSPKTVNQYLTLLGSVFKWSVDQGLMARNPADRLTVPLKTRASEQRKAYSPAQLQSVVSELPDAQSSHPERYWIPIIALYSGLRLEEVAKLRLADLITPDDILCFNIDGAHLKTDTSKRLVPVHPQLLKLGLGAYIENIRATTESTECDAYLFPHLPADRFGRRGKFAGDWYGQFLRTTCGVTDTKVTFHSFRHTFATALKHAEVEGPIIAELLGHTMQGQTFGRYAKKYRPSMLYTAVSKIGFDIDWQ